jgi:hypothetical protein
MPKVNKGNLQHIHIHIHTEKSKPKPKSKPKSKNLRDKSNFRNRRGKKGLSHQDIGSHIPFNAVSNPLAVQLNTLENMRLNLLPTAGHDIGEYFGARSAFGLSHPIQEQINRIDNQTKNINSRMDDAVKMFSQFKQPMPEPEEEPIPSSSTFIRGTTFDLDKDDLTENSPTIASPAPAPKPAPAPTPAPTPAPDSDSESDDESDDEGVVRQIFTDLQQAKIKYNTLSTIPQLLWIKIFNELGYAIPRKPTDSINQQASQAKYKRVLRSEFEKRNGVKKHLIDYDVIQKLV